MGIFARFLAWVSRARTRRALPLRSTAIVVRAYVLASCEFADRLSNADAYPTVQIEAALLAWEAAEREYADRGYRTIGLQEFVDHIAWGVPLSGVGTLRDADEDPVLHARYYRIFCIRRRSSVRELKTLLADEGLLDYEPTRRFRKLQS